MTLFLVPTLSASPRRLRLPFAPTRITRVSERLLVVELKQDIRLLRPVVDDFPVCWFDRLVDVLAHIYVTTPWVDGVHAQGSFVPIQHE